MPKMVTCAKCKGKGSVWDHSSPFSSKEKPCPVCGGSGKVDQK